MASFPSEEKLRAFIRKVVKEELNKAQHSQGEPDMISGPPDSFNLDPRFSTGHYTVEQDPFPHSGQRNSSRRRSKRQTGKRASEPFSHHFGPPPPSGIFGPVSPHPEQFPPEQHKTDGPRPQGPVGEQPGNIPPPYTGFGPPPVPEPGRSGRNDKH